MRASSGAGKYGISGTGQRHTIQIHYRECLEAVNPSKLKACIEASRREITESLKGKHVIFDVKKLHVVSLKSRGCNGLHIMNAWVSETELSLRQERVDDKTNELTVCNGVADRPAGIGCAMGTHSSIAEQILIQGGDCLMALKENQPILRDLVESMFNIGNPLSVNVSA